MVTFALNQISAPTNAWWNLARIAHRADCVGIELRNDLGRPLFEGDAATSVRRGLSEIGLDLIAVAQVGQFNALDDAGYDAAAALIDAAGRSGAEAVALIPRVGGAEVPHTRTVAALVRLRPLLDAAGIRGLVEPIGFAGSSLRTKAAALAAIDDAGGADAYALIHDTFHHTLAGEKQVFAARTGLVHVSGVARNIPATEMRDEDRVLVDDRDVLGNLDQLRRLVRSGYAGPISIEAFSPEVQQLPDPIAALKACFDHLRRHLDIQMPEPAT
jgi:2-keto-myo-inositol isomerase